MPNRRSNRVMLLPATGAGGHVARLAAVRSGAGTATAVTALGVVAMAAVVLVAAGVVAVRGSRRRRRPSGPALRSAAGGSDAAGRPGRHPGLDRPGPPPPPSPAVPPRSALVDDPPRPPKTRVPLRRPISRSAPAWPPLARPRDPQPRDPQLHDSQPRTVRGRTPIVPGRPSGARRQPTAPGPAPAGSGAGAADGRFIAPPARRTPPPRPAPSPARRGQPAGPGPEVAGRPAGGHQSGPTRREGDGDRRADRVLHRFVRETPGAEAAFAVSADGLLITYAAADLPRPAAEKLAAVIAGIQPLTDGVSVLPGCPGPDIAVLDLHGRHLLVSSLNPAVTLGVVAEPGRDLNRIGVALAATGSRVGLVLTPALVAELRLGLPG